MDPMAAPSLSLPKGGGAIRGIGEKLGANPVTGTGSLSVPIAASPGRSGFGPQLALSYDSGAGNGPFGLGWRLSAPAITRKTDKGLPLYEDDRESDVFLISDAEDLVPVLVRCGDEWKRDEFEVTRGGATFRVQRYRPRVEGAFARIERWRDAATGETHWRTISRDNVFSLYGDSPASRIADPENPLRVFSWLLARTWDDRGNLAAYEYKAEDREGVPDALHERHRSVAANRYCKRVLYGNAQPTDPNDPVLPCGWHFQLVFDYGDHDAARPRVAEDAAWPSRPDAFSTYRAGFEVRTYRLCRRVLMFHHFAELGEEPCLIRSTDFTYDETPLHSRLLAATQTGYLRNPLDGGYRICDPQTGEALSPRSLPALEMGYSVATIDDTLRRVARDSVENLPAGVDGGRYQWIDRDGEGLPGVLTEQADAWFYKRNVSALPRADGVTVARFAPLEWVASKPSTSNLGGGRQHFMDLAGDGHLSLVQYTRPMAGFYERLPEEGWLSFRPFAHEPNLDWNNPNLKMIDLDGDGHADVLISEDEVFTWYPSRVREGFGPAQRVPRPFDEERGPALIFADGSETLFLADLSGDGLTDLVRIRNGEVCYWPNRGYGHFGAKVTMDGSPVFDDADRFDPRRIRLADVDGSGATDIVYLGADGIRIYFNQSGNAWSAARVLPQFPVTGRLDEVTVVDLLGNGTACIVWSSALPGEARSPLRYVDLMGGTKPYLLTELRNNLGAETRVHYAPSTRFYLADRAAGTPWITRLPFPVHVVERVEVFDRVSGNRFVTRYAYHHGYFDGVEREFRGFGMVEQRDTEEFATLAGGPEAGAGNWDAASHVPPMLTRTWFHTGFFVARDRFSRQFEREYYRDPEADHLLADTVLPPGLSTWEAREACRALKGSILRQEIYALDGTEAESRPYSVSERNYTLRLLQPRGGNLHTVFFAHSRETIDFQYERKPDPRVTHAFTLAVDDYGNVLQSAAVGYGRRHDDPDPLLTPADRAEQKRLRITSTENGYTNAILEGGAYRTPLPSETRAYEVLQLTPASHHFFRLEEMHRGLEQAGDGRHDLPYEDVNASGAVEDHPYRRLIDQKRTLYRHDDLSGPLPLGRVEPLGLPFESLSLALTPGLIAQVYGGRVTDGMLANEGGYRHSEGDENWWIPSGEIFYSLEEGDSPQHELAYARRHFFLPHRFRDPFGQATTVTYDGYDLMIQETRDALGNRVTAGERDAAGNLTKPGLDYRVLQPGLVMDANRNRAAVAFDVLGMVVGTAVMGKPEEHLGDSLDGFAADLPPSVIVEHLRHPFAHSHELLHRATTRLVYDLFAYQRTQADAQPQGPVVYTLARETHDSDLKLGERTKIQFSFSYSDGFAREVQKKIQAEPGPLEDGGPEVSPRWVGSGWTIFNNKGKPVRQFEPFFTATHHFELARKVGVSPILCYDPAGRVIVTLHPNHTWEKVVFDPWRQESWDVNDTVLLDPREDPEAGGFVVRLPEDDYLPTWYEERAEGALGRREQDAARKASVHAGTPAAACFDSLGRTFLTIANNRFLRDGEPVEERLATRVALDIEGNQREIVDARQRSVMRYDYDVLSHRIHQASMEAGERWMLNDVAGKPVYSRDSREHTLRSTYDALRRPVAIFLREGTGEEKQIGRTIYGEESPDPELNNLRGKAHQVFDTAGVATSERYDFKGNLLASRRQLAASYKQVPDWSASPALEAERFIGSTVYDALNRPIQVVAPHAAGTRASVLQPTYNEAALLEKLDVWPRFDGEPSTLLDGADLHAVTNLDYNAKGQRILIEYGNGVRTDYDYDPLTFRLRRLHTRRGGHPLQDLSYTFDPSGNITQIRDDAQETIFFRNQVVEPSADYTYDALYRLIAATGREHLGQPGGAPEPTSWTDEPRVGLPQPGDGAAMGRYRERYEYDEVGNFLRMIHHGEPHASGGWTRTYRYDEPSQLAASQVSNRLTSTQTGDHAAERYGYDADGNITAISHLSLMQWDFRDQLQAVARQAAGEDATRETTYYVYDGGGQRVRKVTERTARSKERIYLGGFEIYREYDTQGNVDLERETLHVMDDKQRVALIETRTQGSDPAPAHLVRYQLGNHLSSAALELDEDARVISYEEYYPYGSTSYQEVRSGTETPKRYRYTGKERDEESGFYYHGARYYAPWLGRWTSSDPLGIGDGPNTYQYSRANPVVVFDPTGLEGEGVITIPEVTIVGDAREAKAEGHISSWLESHGLSSTSPTDLALSLGLGPVTMQYLEGYLQQQGFFKLPATTPPEPYKGPSIGPSDLSADDFREMTRARDEAERRANHPNAYDIMVSDAQIVSHAVDPSGMGIIKGPATVVMTASGVDPEKAQQIATVLDFGAGLLAMTRPHGPDVVAPVEELQTNSLVLRAEPETPAAPLSRMSDRAIAQSHLNYANAVTMINAAETLGPEFPSWMAENQGWMARGRAVQSTLASSLASNPVTSQMWSGIDQPPGVSVPDLLHTGSGNASPFGEVFPLNERQIAEHSNRWYSPYSDFFMYTQPPSGWTPPPGLQLFMLRTR
jgi:RHS repeat-associated protein